MRVACIYLPCFPLQVHVRRAPHLAGTAFAVSHGAEHPKVLVCSKAAWQEGVRPGMSIPQARAQLAGLDVIHTPISQYRQALEALGEVLLAESAIVDIGDDLNSNDNLASASMTPHRAIYLEVPRGVRGNSFADKLFEHLNSHGYRARIGISDDRFSAWAASYVAKDKQSLFAQAKHTVPRGGAAAFLAPLPIDLLPLDEDLRHMLNTLGIASLGDFSALPPPSVGMRWHREGVDLQQIAQGNGPRILRSFQPQESIVESIDLESPVDISEPLLFTLRPIVDRLCERLRGRGMAAAALELRLLDERSAKNRLGPVLGAPVLGGDGQNEITRFTLSPSRPTQSTAVLQDLFRAYLGDKQLKYAVSGLEVEVIDEAYPEVDELDLFDKRDDATASDAIDLAMARLRSVIDEDAAQEAELVDTHTPEQSFRLTPFKPPRRKPARRSSRKRSSGKKHSTSNSSNPKAAKPVLPLITNGMVGALRLYDPPKPQSKELSSIRVEGNQLDVVASHGPTRIDVAWWSGQAVERDYYEVETSDGGRYWVFRKKNDPRYYLHGIFD